VFIILVLYHHQPFVFKGVKSGRYRQNALQWPKLQIAVIMKP